MKGKKASDTQVTRTVVRKILSRKYEQEETLEKHAGMLWRTICGTTYWRHCHFNIRCPLCKQGLADEWISECLGHSFFQDRDELTVSVGSLREHADSFKGIAASSVSTDFDYLLTHLPKS